MFVSSRVEDQLHRLLGEQALQQLRVGGTAQNWLQHHAIRHEGTKLLLDGIERRFTPLQQNQPGWRKGKDLTAEF